ncbi:MAG: hypothetical protein HRT45_16760 [Bdellovibrionales bacterium]|nr:hypothetical protein [Bdellovibrionales bacterium]
MSTLQKLRTEILECLDQGQKPRLILDLDSTIFCVSPRTQFILRQFHSSQHAKPFLESHKQAIDILNAIETLPTDWGIRSSMIRHEVFARLDFFEAVRKHWVEGFFSNEMLIHDVPYKGAVEFVRECYTLGAHISYLTGRDVPRMGEGTREQLIRHGLPLDNDHDLQMKANSGLGDTNYKAEYFENLDGDLKHVWFVDNEPVLLHEIERRTPELNLIYTDTVHSGREEPSPKWPSIGMSWSL